MTTVVLGWDGLDHELLADYGMESAFGECAHPIETLVNDELGKPHTWELWPSIITGCQPDVHGIHADEYIESNWSSAWLRAAATLSKPIPDALRWRVGRLVRDAGATMAFESADYYAQRGVETVFDGRGCLALGVPNYRSDADERYEISHDRGAELADYMDTETDSDGETRRTPAVTPETFAARIEADCAEKIGLVRNALDRDYDLVFVWLAYLDTAGHVAPTVEDTDRWLRRHYEAAATYTNMIHDQLDSDETLITLSDHGLQNGEHTETACIGAWPGEAVADVESVLDVAAAINRCTDRGGDTGERFAVDDEAQDDVQERLQTLGYID